MQTYAVYIEDDRYSVPTLLLVTAKDDAAIRAIAREKLFEPHHQVVEVRDNDRVVCRLIPPNRRDRSDQPNSS